MRISDKSFPPNSRYYPRIERVILTQDWYACGWATGTRTAYDDETKNIYPQGNLVDPVASADPDMESYTFVLFDPDGIINGELMAVADDDGALYLPAGLTAKIYQPEDSHDGHWELVNSGQMCGGSEEGSEEGSETSETSETSESSETSEGEGSGACVTPADMGWPSPPGNGTYLLGVSNGCVKWIPAGPCSPGSGS